MFAPIDAERERRDENRSIDEREGRSSSGSRLMRSDWCDEVGREGAINWETASPPRWRTRRWCCAATSKRVATRLRFGLGELVSGRNSAQRELSSSGGGDGWD